MGEEYLKHAEKRSKETKRTFLLVLRAIKGLEQSGLCVPKGMWKALENAHHAHIGWESDVQYIQGKRAAQPENITVVP